MQTARGRCRGRGGAVTATVTKGGRDTGNGTIILILSFISLTLLGESKEYLTVKRRGRSTGNSAKDYG